MRSLSQNTYCHNEKSGVTPRKGAHFEQEREICPVPDAGEKSGAGTPLSGGREPQSYVDGRLGQMEDRMSSLLYKQAVEQDMVAGILADAYQFSEEDLKRRRAESISNVKKTNGRVSLDQRVREVWEEGDEWQD